MIKKIIPSALDQILPPVGTPRKVHTPIWDENQHMFITDQYVSNAGNTYYLGIRFCERFMTVLHIGLYHSWTYINEVEIYAFDGNQRKLISKTSIDTYYNEDLVRSATETMLQNYIESQYKMNRISINQNEIKSQIKELVDSSYLSLLNDPTINKKLESVIPLLENK